MRKRLSTTFRSVKNNNNNPDPPPSSSSSSSSSPSKKKKAPASSSSTINTNVIKKEKKKKMTSSSAWSVYLIISSRLPKTYVGVTTNFSRRLKQHNGELKGGAKASSAGRPWTLVCIVRGFLNRSEACEFEYKWKSISRKMPRKKKNEDDASIRLLQHREAALSRLKASFNCGHLLIEWQSNSL
ncbi:putative structure-specific endonuclease subunit slx1 [Iris pallida]|uniref:Structure-specific endonuclease subunit slx1 n=1 Tax=Iris pallida TaxID=29817 RepID=A0AAX6HU00_IRIPA|nr:putative structure-specific endonuclease subunit slx1 [Iris pallida]